MGKVAHARGPSMSLTGRRSRISHWEERSFFPVGNHVHPSRAVIWVDRGFLGSRALPCPDLCSLRSGVQTHVLVYGAVICRLTARRFNVELAKQGI
jgi:hypothetical protein